MERNTHRRLCLITAAWLKKQKFIDHVAWEMSWNSGFVDAIGFSSYGKPNPRVVCIEVKKSRGDLLADINSGKYMKYEEGASHCYLAGTPSSFSLKSLKVADRLSVIRDLKSRGFPDSWGILLLPRSGYAKPKLLRAAKILRTPLNVELLTITKKALNALANKGLRRIDLD